MTRALVLGSGGFGGIAWEVGVLKGLRDAGLDIASWDLVVGTSAGANVGARLLGEGSIDRLFAEQVVVNVKHEEMRLAQAVGVGPVRALRLGRRPGLGWLSRGWFAAIGVSALIRYLLRQGMSEIRHLGPILRIRRPGADVSAEVLARLGGIARSARTRGEKRWVEYWRVALEPVVEWPSARLIVTALDVVDGSRIAFEASSGLDLAQAVAASTALPMLISPITAGQRRYMDGGSGSQTNADLARGFEEVVIVAPVDRGQLTGEVAALEASGARVFVIRPSPRAEIALGNDLALLDLLRRPGAANAGHADGSSNPWKPEPHRG